MRGYTADMKAIYPGDGATVDEDTRTTEGYALMGTDR